MKKIFKYMGLVSSATLIACGGGGGDSGAQIGGGPKPGDVTDSRIATSIVYQFDKNAVSNSGADEATLTVTALDSNNNPVQDSKLSVAVDSGVYTPVTNNSDISGKASGKISIGSNKSNRDIGVTINMGGKTTQTVLPVTGSQIALSLIPATPTPGGSVDVSVKVTDINGAGIEKTDIKLAGTLGFVQTLTSDTSGNAVAKLIKAPNAAGTYTVEAIGAGVIARLEVPVFSIGGASIPDAKGVISAANLAITPNTIAPNTAGSSANRAGLRAIFQNAANQAIPNVRARFEILAPKLESGEKISIDNAVVYSDLNGQVNAEYIAGTRSSPTDGVNIRVCYGMTDAEVADPACPKRQDATMTVASKPVSITLGDNNKLERGANELTYIKKFDIAVVDSAGNAVQNAQISASVDLVEYAKGEYYNPKKLSDPSQLPDLSKLPKWCKNEDLNRNGFLDTNEKDNPDPKVGDGDNEISPRKADVTLSYVGEKTTGVNGRATIQAEYPMNVATWLKYKVKVTTSVAGSEGTVEKLYITEFIEGDDTNGSFLTPAYGVNDCKTPN